MKMILLTAALFLFVFNIASAVNSPVRHRAYVTAYSTHEHLTGCHDSHGNYTPGVCHTACGSLLNDKKFTVAANPKLNLDCGQRINFCGIVGRKAHCAIATVTDVTGSFFDFEFSYALTQATGQSSRNWADPHHVTYYLIGRY